jgi:acetylornithine/succinyldiaminopimelate/putrescine aminotransferase
MFMQYLGLPTLQPMALEITKAEGIYLFDRHGRKYIDLISGVTVSNLGHGHPDVLNAVKEQVDRHMHLMVYGELVQDPQVDLARELAGCLPPSLGCTYFVNSGSEAIEGALKLAKRYTGRTEVISYYGAYHGGTAGALSILGDERLKNAFRPLVPGTRLIRFNELEDLKHITDHTACVVAETTQAEAGIIPALPGYLQALRRRCNETGTLLVIDDVQMGLGRTGRLFSFEDDEIFPDILVLAKAFGGGMPLGAFIASRDIMSSLAFNPELGHITTFGGHPVSCAAALASLRFLMINRPYLHAGQRAWIFTEKIRGHKAVKAVRHKGLMIAVELGSPSTTAEFLRQLLHAGALSDSFLFRPQAFRIAPPLTITEQEALDCADLILSCLDRI